VPDMLAAGPRDVLVPASGAGPARDVLLQADLLPTPSSMPDGPGRVLAGLLGSIVLVAVILWIGTDVIS